MRFKTPLCNIINNVLFGATSMFKFETCIQSLIVMTRAVDTIKFKKTRFLGFLKPVLFSALLASRVGRIMHDVPPTSSVFRHSLYQVLCLSGPCSYNIIHPVDPRSSFFRPPGTVPCMISFSKHDPFCLMMCLKYFIFLSFTIPSNQG